MEGVATGFEQLEGKYEILEKMSEGGMGAVYKVRHRLLDEVRVIKVMRPHLAEDPVLRKRFIREAKTATRLDHANLARVYDFTMDESGYFFLAMEFIDGIDLHGLLKGWSPIPPGVVLEIADQTLDVLGYLHRKEIVHRDISPDNVLIARDEDGGFRVKLIDLGIAKVAASHESLTATGIFLGKVRYSSPEHFKSRNEQELDRRSDLYSFGVVLYELLTAAYPIKGKNIPSLINGHLMHPPRPFETTDAEGRVPDDLRAVVLKALEKDPGDRFQTAEDFREAVSTVRRRFPVEEDYLVGVLEDQRVPTARIPVERPGSTQERLDRNFGVETTPSSGGPIPVEPESGTEFETAGFPLSRESDRTAGRTDDVDRQIRALLLGAEKLIEAQHFEEARFQLETAESLGPGRPETAALVEVLDRADTAVRRRREQAALEIETLIRAEEYAGARRLIERRRKEIGGAVFDDLEGAVNQAEEAAAERSTRAADILTAARQLIDEDRWEDAVPMIREVLVLTPGNTEAADLLSEAEAGLAALREERRLEVEIEGAAATIEAALQRGDFDEVRRSLRLAEKLYGDHPRFADFPKKLKKCEDEERRERAGRFGAEARSLVEDGDFIAAALKLELALELTPGDRELSEALAEVSELQRLKEEAEYRRRVIDETVGGVERLVTAHRFEAAAVVLDRGVEALGEFEREQELRTLIEKTAEEHREVERQIGETMKIIEDAVSNEDFKRAQDAVDRVRQLAGDHPEALDAVDAMLIDLETAENDYRKAMDVSTAVRSIERHLAESRLDDAERELRLARRLYGARPIFDDLARRVAEGRRGRERERRREAIDAAMTSGAPIGDVLTAIESALEFDPFDREFRELLARARRMEREENRRRRQPEIEEILAKVDDSIAADRIGEALEILDEAVARLGPFPEARALRVRLGG